MLDKTSDQASNLEQESYFSNANVEGVTWSEAIKEASKPDSKQARKQVIKQASKWFYKGLFRDLTAWE